MHAKAVSPGPFFHNLGSPDRNNRSETCLKARNSNYEALVRVKVSTYWTVQLPMVLDII